MDDLNVLTGETPVYEPLEEVKVMDSWIFTNDKTNPMIEQLFHLFYDSVFQNRIGLMHSLHEPTGEIHTILVGVDKDPDGNIATWPIAKVLTEEQQSEYRAPDGEGNYIV